MSSELLKGNQSSAPAQRAAIEQMPADMISPQTTIDNLPASQIANAASIRFSQSA